MSRVLIVSKTKMAESRVCVGGIDLTTGISIRLLDSNGHHEYDFSCPFNIGDLWDISYTRDNRRPAPHTEDTRVLNRNIIQSNYCHSADQFIRELRCQGIGIVRGSISDCFNSCLVHDKQYYITHGRVPEHSTCFWINDRPLRKNDFQDKKRISYLDGSTPWGTSIAFVGLGPTPDYVPEGSLIRLSLANWWQKPGDLEERCYLQVSGIY